MIKKYKLSISEEIGGIIEIKAESQEKAEELAEELMDEYGVDKLFYADWNTAGCDEDLTKYNGKHTHRDAQVHTCEEVK